MPWLLMTGTKDVARLGGGTIGAATVEKRLSVFPALPAGSKYELVLDGAEHSAFTDRALPGESGTRNPNHHRAILALSTAFWDAYLKGDAAARAWLDGNGPRGCVGGQGPLAEEMNDTAIRLDQTMKATIFLQTILLCLPLFAEESRELPEGRVADRIRQTDRNGEVGISREEGGARQPADRTPGQAAGGIPPARPNIILILADDLGWGDLGCYGHPHAQTPQLDRLAADGTRFTQCYATGVTCCPARTGLMTGRFPATFGKYPAAFGFGERTTVTQLLKQHGYATGHFGKWHIGPVKLPGTYGIDVIGHDEEILPGGRKRTPERGRDASVFDEAIRFIETHRGGPFYVNIWGHIAHHPVNPARRFTDAFNDLKVNEAGFSDFQREKFATVRENGGDVDEAVRSYLGDLHSLDQDVGRLLRRLDELGLRDNTLVVFSADQGAAAPKAGDDAAPGKKRRTENAPDPERARLALNLMGYAGPQFRGGKHSDLEGGVRVPWIMRWPGRVPAGRTDTRSVLSGADWLPSLCALTGIGIDAARFDGEDSSRAWLGGTHTRAKPLFWKTNAENSAPAMRWENWKLRVPQRRRAAPELYDLATDPGERTNLAARHPDILRQLTGKTAAWTASLPGHYEHGEAKED
jgi:arylsulfatase A-like enzyme